MSRYERTCSYIIETFQQMIMYLSQNNRKDAALSFATVSEFVNDSRKDTDNLIADFEKAHKAMADFAKKILQTARDGLKAAKKELEEIKSNDNELALEDALGTAAVAGYAGVLIAFPLFALVGIGGIAYAVYKRKRKALKEESELNRQKECELRDAQEKQLQIEIDARLEELVRGVEPEKNLEGCLKVAMWYLTRMKRALQELQAGWEAIEKTCEDIKKNDQQLMRHGDKDECSKAFEGYALKVHVVECFASWVALKAFARRCNKSLNAAVKTLDDRSTVNITKEAKEYRQGAARNDDFLCLTHPEQCEDHDN